MDYFIFSGKRKIKLHLRSRNADFFCKDIKSFCFSRESLEREIDRFFIENSKAFQKKRVCVVIPDNTRSFHPKIVLPIIDKCLEHIGCKVNYFVSLGLHRTLNKNRLGQLLDKSFVKNHRVIQHSLKDVRFLGNISGVPVFLNRNLSSFDTILTIGVVEPHLYAGFSGGVKCIAIGLAGKKTILKTHSLRYLSQKNVVFSKTQKNPFQNYLWSVCKELSQPIYSLNLVNDINKQISFYSLGRAKKSYLESVCFAKKKFSYKIRKKFDVVFVGCDSPKDKSLYQVSRIFNYMLDKKPLVKKSGVICVFANLENKNKSKAERNFEAVLKKTNLAKHYSFKRPGEHRAFKVLEAAKHVKLCVVSPSVPSGKFSSLLFFKSYKDVMKMSIEYMGKNIKIGIIPSGFSFIPS